MMNTRKMEVGIVQNQISHSSLSIRELDRDFLRNQMKKFLTLHKEPTLMKDLFNKVKSLMESLISS